MKHLKENLIKVDWDLLRLQKEHLLAITREDAKGGHPDLLLEGLISFIDSIQDSVVSDKLVKEDVVFKED